MIRERQIQLVQRVLAHVEARTTDTTDAAEALDVSAYADDARIERETSVLFRQLPLAIAHGSELPAPGDFITHDRSGVPLLVVRRDDEERHA